MDKFSTILKKLAPFYAHFSALHLFGSGNFSAQNCCNAILRYKQKSTQAEGIESLDCGGGAQRAIFENCCNAILRREQKSTQAEGFESLSRGDGAMWSLKTVAMPAFNKSKSQPKREGFYSFSCGGDGVQCVVYENCCNAMKKKKI